MAFLNYYLNDVESSFNIWKFILDLGPVIVSIIAVLTTLIVTKKTLTSQANQNLITLNAQKDIESRQIIQKKLNELYGPLIQQRIKSSKLYDKFSKKYRENDRNFSTLLYLMDNYKFEGNDNVLLEQIINLGKESEKLIQEKAGLIDDSELRLEIIPKATTHFLLMRLAYEGKLSGNSDEFRDLTYPNELIYKLEKRKKQLEEDLEKLNMRQI